MVIHASSYAQVQSVTPDYSIAVIVPVYATAIIVLGIVALVTVAVLRADPKDCPETIRAVAELIRAFAEVVRGVWRGGPPNGPT